MKKPLPHTALGVTTGDIVTTSYNSGPYEVWSITPPHYTEKGVGSFTVRTWPEISLTLNKPGEAIHTISSLYWINDIRKEGTRYLTCRDEVFIAPGNHTACQLGLFGDIEELEPLPPYELQEGVDYLAGWRNVWHCDNCGRDWNDYTAYEAMKPCEFLVCEFCPHWGAHCLLYLPEPLPVGRHGLDQNLDYYLSQLRETGKIATYEHMTASIKEELYAKLGALGGRK